MLNNKYNTGNKLYNILLLEPPLGNSWILLGTTLGSREEYVFFCTLYVFVRIQLFTVYYSVDFINNTVLYKL